MEVKKKANMCRCNEVNSAFSKSFIKGIEKIPTNWSDLEGLRRRKGWIDEKYADLDAILSDKRKKVSKNTGKHLCHTK